MRCRRVLIVDDSSFMRRMLTNIISTDGGFEVSGYACDGLQAVAMAKDLSPDVIAMDVEMPRMDGISATREIMKSHPTPIVMVSSQTLPGAASTIEALAAGAVDFVHKPSAELASDLSRKRDEIVRKLRLAAISKPRIPVCQRPDCRSAHSPRPSSSGWIVAIMASTGGPSALTEVLSAVGPLSSPVLIVQHMPSGFTAALAARLDSTSHLHIIEARGGESLTAGKAFVAPGGLHMAVSRDMRIRLLDTPPQHGVRPAADVLLDSLARHDQARVLAVVLTGMGFDGTRGCAAVRRAGGYVIAEDESTCVVYGMPRAVIETGNADRILRIGEIAHGIREVVSGVAG